MSFIAKEMLRMTYGSSILPPNHDQGCKRTASELVDWPLQDVGGEMKLISAVHFDGSSTFVCRNSVILVVDGI